MTDSKSPRPLPHQSSVIGHQSSVIFYQVISHLSSVFRIPYQVTRQMKHLRYSDSRHEAETGWSGACPRCSRNWIERPESSATWPSMSAKRPRSTRPEQEQVTRTPSASGHVDRRAVEAQVRLQARLLPPRARAAGELGRVADHDAELLARGPEVLQRGQGIGGFEPGPLDVVNRRVVPRDLDGDRGAVHTQDRPRAAVLQGALRARTRRRYSSKGRGRSCRAQ